MTAADKIAEARALIEPLTIVMVSSDLTDCEDFPDGPCVILRGSIEAVRAAASRFGDAVVLAEPDQYEAQVQDGWIYHCPDSGIEWSEDHPVESGQCFDASDVRPATVDNLKLELLAAWEMQAEERARADALAQENAKLREALAAYAEDADCDLCDRPVSSGAFARSVLGVNP